MCLIAFYHSWHRVFVHFYENKKLGEMAIVVPFGLRHCILGIARHELTQSKPDNFVEQRHAFM